MTGAQQGGLSWWCTSGLASETTKMDEIVWGGRKREQRPYGQALARSKFSEEANVKGGGLMSKLEVKTRRQHEQTVSEKLS